MRKLYITPGRTNSPTKNPLIATLPSSKSHTQRAYLFALMGEGLSTIDNPLLSFDTEAMLEAIQSLGARIVSRENHRIIIEGTGGYLSSPHSPIDAKNSGQVLRFIGALASLLPTKTIITGDLSIQKNRPVTPLLEGIRQLGGRADSLLAPGTAPIWIQGPIRPGKVHLSGECSQPVSGLIIASCFLPEATEIIVHNPGEKPWLRLTLSWLDKLKLRYRETDLSHFYIEGQGHYPGFSVTIPSDISSAAFPAAGAIVTNTPMILPHIDTSSHQGDLKFFTLLEQLGADVSLDPFKQTIAINTKNPNKQLRGGVFSINDCIDALPILSVIGCFCSRPLTLTDAWIARKKESDRIACMTRELSKMGAVLEEHPDGLTIYPSRLHGATVSSCEDHRVAMALSIAAMGATNGTSCIENTSCIDKSFPDYKKQLQSLGFFVEERV